MCPPDYGTERKSDIISRRRYSIDIQGSSSYVHFSLKLEFSAPKCATKAPSAA